LARVNDAITFLVDERSDVFRYSKRSMIWFFDRDGEKLRYEISHDRSANRYRVIITRPDGSESVEEVDEPSQLIERSATLMNSLRGDGWSVA
jgi:hypothetical protein